MERKIKHTRYLEHFSRLVDAHIPALVKVICAQKRA